MKKKPPAIEVRKTERTLKCTFTQDEILALGKDLAEKTELVAQIESDKKRVVKDFDARIAEAEAQIQLGTSKIRSGYEYRIIKCTETLGEPEETKKTVRRLDTDEIVEVRELNPEERQRLIDFDKEQKEAAGQTEEPDAA